MRFQRENDLFVYQYTHPINGRRRRHRGSWEQCEEMRRRVLEARRRLRNGESLRVVAESFVNLDAIPLREVWEEYIAAKATRARESAERCWRTTIDTPVGDGRTLGECRLGELDARLMGRWVLELSAVGGRYGEGRAPATVRLAVDYVGAAVRSVGATPAWEGQWRPPQADAGRQSRPWVRSLDELGRLVRAALTEDQQDWARGRYAARAYLVTVGALTGLRNAELAGLAWDAVELDHGPARMVARYQAPRQWRGERPAEPRKNRDVLRQLLHDEAAAALRQQREQLRRCGWYSERGPVFPTRSGGWRKCGWAIDPDAIRRWALAAGLRDAGNWCPHSLRHSFCSLEVAAAGGNLAAAAKRTGHRDIQALLIYVHELGEGLGLSPVGRVGLFAEAVEPQATRLVEPTGGLLPPPSLAPTWEANATAALERRVEQRRERQAKARRAFADLADEWLAPSSDRRGDNGQVLERPQPVTDAARNNAARAYSRVKRAARGEPDESWKPRASAAWHAAKKATLAAWARALKDAKIRRD